MTVSAQIRNLQADIALLKYFIDQRQKASLSDMPRIVEALAIKIFEASHGYVLSNMNLLSGNYPAIDLADPGQKVAVQVTLNATAAKIRKTIEAFNKHKLSTNYDKLIIFGFMKASKSEPIPSYCTILSTEDIVGILIDRNSAESIQTVCDAIKRHHDYTDIHPWMDKNCLEILINCVDRNAIKHPMSCEGNIDDMDNGLKEITELISKGTIKGRRKSKSIDDFQDQSIIEYMRFVRNAISNISGIINSKKCSNGAMYYLDLTEKMDIDRRKKEIIDRTNEVSNKFGIGITVSSV